MSVTLMRNPRLFHTTPFIYNKNKSFYFKNNNNKTHTKTKTHPSL